MPKEPIFLSREALYIRVWETPTVRLAKELGISDVAIAKICRKLEIPKPPLGYWRRVETGQKKKIPPLGKPGDKTRPGVWIYPKSEEKTLEFDEEYKKENLAVEQNIAEQSAAEALPENKIKVPRTLHKAHSLITKTKDAFSKGGVDTYGALYAPWQEKHLDLRVSRKHLGHALRIMDALIKALEKRECRVSISTGDKIRTEVKVNEQKVGISLREDFKRFERELSDEEKKSRYVSDRYYYQPSGNFTLTIYGAISTQSNWRDGKTAVLEDQLNDVVVGIFRSAEALHQKEIVRKKEERRQIELAIDREKKKILLKKEQACRESLENLSRNWLRSREVYEFVKIFEEKLIEQNGDIIASSDEAEFIEWGYKYAAQLNPLLSNQIGELIEQFKHRTDEPAEDDSYEYSNLLWKLKFV
jgi:hypothetical protein